MKKFVNTYASCNWFSQSSYSYGFDGNHPPNVIWFLHNAKTRERRGRVRTENWGKMRSCLLYVYYPRRWQLLLEKEAEQLKSEKLLKKMTGK